MSDEKFKVGETVVILRPGFAPDTRAVMTVGRKWCTVNGYRGTKFDVSTGRSEGLTQRIMRPESFSRKVADDDALGDLRELGIILDLRVKFRPADLLAKVRKLLPKDEA